MRRFGGPSAELAWGDVLVVTLMMGIVISAVRTWIGLAYVNQNVMDLLVFRGDDAPNLAYPDFKAVPIWGHHYFGDMQEGLSWAHAFISGTNPYELSVSYGPGAVFFYVPWTLFDTRFAVVTLTLLAASSLTYIVWRFIKPEPSLFRRFIALATIGLLTVPFLAVLDRGNLQGLLAVLLGFGLLAWGQGRLWVFLVMTVVTVSLKFYTFVLFVPLFFWRGQWRRVTFASGLAILATLGSLALFPGGLLPTLGNLLSSLYEFSGQAEAWRNSSSEALVLQLASVLLGSDSQAVDVILSTSVWIILGLIWVAGVTLLFYRQRSPSWVLGVLLLASLDVVPPVSYAYAGIWAVFGGFWFYRDDRFPHIGNDSESPIFGTSLRVMGLIAIAATLTPLVLGIQINGVYVDVLNMVAPAALWTLLVMALSSSFRVKRAHRPVMPIDPVIST